MKGRRGRRQAGVTVLMDVLEQLVWLEKLRQCRLGVTSASCLTVVPAGVGLQKLHERRRHYVLLCRSSISRNLFTALVVPVGIYGLEITLCLIAGCDFVVIGRISRKGL